MRDGYQTGSDVAWVQHANDELTRLVKRKNRQVGRLRFCCLVLLLVAGWVVFKYSKVGAIEELWRW